MTSKYCVRIFDDLGECDRTDFDNFASALSYAEVVDGEVWEYSRECMKDMLIDQAVSSYMAKMSKRIVVREA